MLFMQLLVFACSTRAELYGREGQTQTTCDESVHLTPLRGIVLIILCTVPRLC